VQASKFLRVIDFVGGDYSGTRIITQGRRFGMHAVGVLLYPVFAF
jgi:hypothetical protein